MSTSSSDLSGGEIRFVADTESGETMTWLLNFDKIINNGMGGTLAERPGLSGIKAILDLACGPGGWVLDVAREHPEIEVTGVDISQSMIRFAKAQATSRGYGNASFMVMDVKKPLRFEEASFDLVNERTLYGVMGPGEWPQLLAECKRMLRDAGFQDVKHQGHVMDISAGTVDFEGFFRNFVYVFELVKPFMLKIEGLTTEQEWKRLYQHMQAEMLASDFCGLWTYVTAWGEKPQ